ncbi:hypothetical protein [Microbacterium sp. CIAB417]|uniref:hypothetical protein n=1 Tax=Microbacterium sp. CIAB417 TaxID=2860287 RepID=UPI001FAC5C32|nr:hypothetical protein [Microbacterium sp. CIAB417]
MNEFEEIIDDLLAFADDESGAAVDADGTFILQRNGEELSGSLSQGPDGQIWVDIDGAKLPYRRFLTHNLARLDVLAQRLIERRPSVPGFVNADATLQRAAEDVIRNDGLSLLDDRCGIVSPFASRVLFVTADAGHGKTALLREHQFKQAQKFLKGDSHYLFWHLDLQGRQLLRLSEALMGDLAELRLSGLWMPAVVRLMRRGVLIVGIDGFDELAAEQGGVDALGALASLVSQLEGHGVVVAASRRTFFNTDDYLRRGGMVRRGVPDPCQFDQMELDAWTERDVLEYFERAEFDGQHIQNPQDMYSRVLAALGGDASHPLITRPFLVSQIARASVLYDASPEEFLRAPDDPLSGVASVVSTFVTREVAEKWKVRETGEPYLTEAQHFAFLADVAEEMHRSQKDRLPIDIIETIATLLLDQWGIEGGLRQQIIEMVRMHVLLVAPPGSNQSQRMFDHPEFRDYFIAYALKERIAGVMAGGGTNDLVRFLSISQLSDSTARYVCSMLDRDVLGVTTLLSSMEEALNKEWKPTYIQQNLGTLIPFMIDGVGFASAASFTGKAIYSSLAFENTRIRNFTFRDGTFVNASLRSVEWRNVSLEAMALGELQLDRTSIFVDVRLIRCSVEGVRVQSDDEDELREYAPLRIRRALERSGLIVVDEELPIETLDQATDSTNVRLLRKLLRVFHRTTIVSDEVLRTRFGSDSVALEDHLLPLLMKYGVVGSRKWRGSGNHSAWTLTVSLDDFLAGEGTDDSHGRVWRALQRGE